MVGGPEEMKWPAFLATWSGLRSPQGIQQKGLTMDHVGIDLGATKCHVVRLDGKGDVLERQAIRTGEMEGWLKRLEPSRVVMEACTQSPLMSRLAGRNHQAVVISSTLVRALGVGARGIKTDDRDAEVLARASLRNETLPSVHVRSERATHQRELVATRARLVRMRNQTALSVKSYLRGRFIMLKGRANCLAFCTAVRSVLEKTPEGLPSHIELMLETFAFLAKQIERLQEQITEIAEQSEVCKKLMTIPGVGPHVAVAFTCTIDEVARFKSADELGSYLTLSPGEATTGGNIRRTKTLRAGPVWLKALLVQSSWSMWRCRPDSPMVLWAKRIADKRGKRIAIVALARKLATVMWAMWKRDEPFRPERAAKVVTVSPVTSQAEVSAS